MKEGYPVTDGFGLYPTIIKPPYTTLTAYDLNTGTIAWQKGLGDDLRLLPLGITGTGSAATVKGGLIVTGTGLLFATAADRKVHVYDSEHRRGARDAAAGRTDERRAVDVRARWPPVPAGHASPVQPTGRAPWRRRTRGRRHHCLRAAR